MLSNSLFDMDTNTRTKAVEIDIPIIFPEVLVRVKKRRVRFGTCVVNTVLKKRSTWG